MLCQPPAVARLSQAACTRRASFSHSGLVAAAGRKGLCCRSNGSFNHQTRCSIPFLVLCVAAIRSFREPGDLLRILAQSLPAAASRSRASGTRSEERRLDSYVLAVLKCALQHFKKTQRPSFDVARALLGAAASPRCPSSKSISNPVAPIGIRVRMSLNSRQVAGRVRRCCVIQQGGRNLFLQRPLPSATSEQAPQPAEWMEAPARLLGLRAREEVSSLERSRRSRFKASPSDDFRRA